MVFVRPDLNRFIELGYGGQIQNNPFLVFGEKMADQILLVEVLRKNDDNVVLLVIEARVDRVVEPFAGGAAASLRHRPVGLHQVIDDDEIAAAPVSVPPT